MWFILFISLIVASRCVGKSRVECSVKGRETGHRSSADPLLCCLAGLAGVGAHRSPCRGHVHSPGSVCCNRCLEGDSWAVTSPSHPDNRPQPARLSLADCVTVVGLRCVLAVSTPCSGRWLIHWFTTQVSVVYKHWFTTQIFCRWFTSSVTRLVSCLCRARVCVCVCGAYSYPVGGVGHTCLCCDSTMSATSSAKVHGFRLVGSKMGTPILHNFK